MKKDYLFFAGLLLVAGVISYFGFAHIIPWVYPKVEVETWKLFGWVTLASAVSFAAGVLLYGFLDLRRRNIKKQKLLTSGRS